MKELLVFLLLGCGLAQCAILTRSQLEEQLEEAMGRLGESQDLQARIVCHVELTSGFNTSAVKEQKVAHTTWTLYGIFQLSDHLSCSDGETPSHNECGKSCTDFLDSDISNDITCLENMIDLIKQGFGAPNLEEVGTMAKMILHPECISQIP